MIEKLTTGVGMAVRAGAVPVLLGVRIAERRRKHGHPGVPQAKAGWVTTTAAALDEVFFATEIAMAPLISPRERKRVRGELTATIDYYDARGWFDDPSGYHAQPPAAEVSRFDEVRSGWLPYRHMRFESGYDPHEGQPGRERWLDHEANRTAHAWLLKHPGPPRPWLVCVPGYRMGRPTVDFTGFRAGWLHKQLGLNVAIPVMPLHGPRRVGRRGGDGFFSGDFIDTVHAQTQAIWDIRRLIGWLRSHGAPSVGAYGISLGGYTAALLASVEDDLDCVVIGIPATDFSRLLQSHIPNFLLDATRQFGISFSDIESALSVVSPFSFAPRVPHERRFLYAGVVDQLASPDHARDLWRHWGEPRVAWYQGGHISFLWQPEVREILLEALGRSGMADREPLEPAATTA
ncbi:MAG: alpha/beta hydrolase family protein [Myxococcota bacterium]